MAVPELPFRGSIKTNDIMITKKTKTIVGGVKEYTCPEIVELNFSVEAGFCQSKSSQLKDFEENRIYLEEF